MAPAAPAAEAPHLTTRVVAVAGTAATEEAIKTIHRLTISSSQRQAGNIKVPRLVAASTSNHLINRALTAEASLDEGHTTAEKLAQGVIPKYHRPIKITMYPHLHHTGLTIVAVEAVEDVARVITIIAAAEVEVITTIAAAITMTNQLHLNTTKDIVVKIRSTKVEQLNSSTTLRRRVPPTQLADTGVARANMSSIIPCMKPLKRRLTPIMVRKSNSSTINQQNQLISSKILYISVY